MRTDEQKPHVYPTRWLNELANAVYEPLLAEIFTHVVKEDAFVEASLMQEYARSQKHSEFTRSEMKVRNLHGRTTEQALSRCFRKMIADLKTERTPLVLHNR